MKVPHPSVTGRMVWDAGKRGDLWIAFVQLGTAQLSHVECMVVSVPSQHKATLY